MLLVRVRVFVRYCVHVCVLIRVCIHIFVRVCYCDFVRVIVRVSVCVWCLIQCDVDFDIFLHVKS